MRILDGSKKKSILSFRRKLVKRCNRALIRMGYPRHFGLWKRNFNKACNQLYGPRKLFEAPDTKVSEGPGTTELTLDDLIKGKLIVYFIRNVEKAEDFKEWVRTNLRGITGIKIPFPDRIEGLFAYFTKGTTTNNVVLNYCVNVDELPSHAEYLVGYDSLELPDRLRGLSSEYIKAKDFVIRELYTEDLVTIEQTKHLIYEDRKEREAKAKRLKAIREKELENQCKYDDILEGCVAVRYVTYQSLSLLMKCFEITRGVPIKEYTSCVNDDNLFVVVDPVTHEIVITASEEYIQSIGVKYLVNYSCIESGLFKVYDSLKEDSSLEPDVSLFGEAKTRVITFEEWRSN